jgi:hypothetical protein
LGLWPALLWAGQVLGPTDKGVFMTNTPADFNDISLLLLVEEMESIIDMLEEMKLCFWSEKIMMNPRRYGIIWASFKITVDKFERAFRIYLKKGGAL